MIRHWSSSSITFLLVFLAEAPSMKTATIETRENNTSLVGKTRLGYACAYFEHHLTAVESGAGLFTGRITHFA